MTLKKIFLSFLIFLGIAIISYAQIATGKKSELYVSYSRMDITPPVGIKMAGYEQRTGPSVGIHDPLYAKILILEVDGKRTAIISCDLATFSSKKVLETAREKYNIPNVLICYSHTHSGPDIRSDIDYYNSVEKAMIDGMGKALENKFIARISAGSKTFPQLGYNRITGKEKDIALWRDIERIPYGPVDPEVGVIKIEDENGNPRVILMMYACHAVVNHHNYEISADYPGVATRKVEEAFGKNTMCMFIQGGAGNINPMFMSPVLGPDGKPQKTDYTLIEKMGGLLATQVIETAKTLVPAEKETSVKVMSDSIKFNGRFKEQDLNVHITTILINNEIGIAASPGEFFVQHQLFWKEKADVPYPFFFGYTYSSAGVIPGYVPDIRSAAFGGYGANVTTNIEVGGGEIIMLRHLQNLYRLKGLFK